MNNLDHLVRMEPVKGVGGGGERYKAARERLDLVVDMLESGKTGKHEDISDFGKGQIVIARQLGQTSPKCQVLYGALSMQ